MSTIEWPKTFHLPGHVTLLMCQHAQDGVEDLVEIFADILGQKSQYKKAMLLKQGVLAPVTAIGVVVG